MILTEITIFVILVWIAVIFARQAKKNEHYVKHWKKMYEIAESGRVDYRDKYWDSEKKWLDRKGRID